jgi:hypothetical protein
MENRAFGVLATALLVCCAYASGARAEPLRVLYAEPFQAQTPRTPGAQKSGPANLRVQAFGRTFELQLEDNSRLLRGASAQARQRIGSIQLLKGTIKDAPDSWVRLALANGRYSGAFWDGAELYAIAPREELDSALLTPMAAAATGIYRLSDTQGGLFSGTCAVAGGAPSSASPIAKFRSLINELRASADSAFAAVASREIEISMIGDFEFTSQHGSSAVSTMVDRMNVVDGIFSSQVGVTTIPTDFITFASDNDPFTSSEPSTLLNQFADYRNATPTVRNRGLAHLLTGRQLDGNTIGIAFLGSVCAARSGAGLSEISSFIDSPLVMAHEIGHNFGAPHDGETGSPCVNTPATFLMAPQLNGNSNFSACSLQQIQTRIQVAACIVPARNRDLAVRVPSDSMQAIIDQPFQYIVDVDSVGDTPALNAVLSIGTSAQILAFSMPGASCGPGAGGLRCEIQEFPPGESRRLTLTLQSRDNGQTLVTNTVTSTNDVNPANDSRTVTVQMLVARALRVAITPQPLQVTSDEPFEMTYEVTATGAFTVNDARAAIELNGAVAQSAIVEGGGTCTIGAAPSAVTCQIGAVAPGTARRVRVRWVADFGDLLIAGSVRAFDASDPAADTAESFAVVVRAARNVVLISPETFKRVAIGNDAVWSLEVRSIGLDAVNDVHLQLSSAPGVVLAVDPPLAASCTTVSDKLDCALGSMPAGSSRGLQFRSRSDVATTALIRAELVEPVPDDVSGGDFVSLTLDVRAGDEITVNADAARPFDGQLSLLSVNATALGANASENVHVSLSMPAGFTVQSAVFGNNVCTVDTDAPQVTCFQARIEPFDPVEVRVLYVAPLTGTFTGSVQVSADRDTDPTNNSRTIPFEVVPYIDAQVVAPPQPAPVIGATLDLVFTVQTNQHALPDARLGFDWSGPLDQVSASAPGATCAASGFTGVTCDWTSLPANTSVPVSVRLHASVRAIGTLSAFLSSRADVQTANNFGSVAFSIVVPGDAAVSVAQSSVAATRGQALDLPAIDIVTLSPLESGTVELIFDATQVQLLSTSNAVCISTQPIRCDVSGMNDPGTRRMALQMLPLRTGDAQVRIRVSAMNDFNPANDEQTITLTVVDAPPPPPPPPPPPSGGNGGGGGGGGGSMDWLLAALLLLMWHHRWARFRAYR